MTRKLPWERINKSIVGTPNSAISTPIRQQKAKRDESDGDDRELAASPAPIKRVKKSPSKFATPLSRIPRAPSTSPPPEPLPESYMIDGLEHDDMYRMVEDEFLSTARQFTAHLHAVEYHRLKAASKSQNADTIRNISRPVVGRMTDLVKKKQRAAVGKAMANKDQDDDIESREDDSWQSASLYGLMEKPRQQAMRLDNLTKVTGTTRAAAGFSTARPLSSFATPRPMPSKFPSSKSTTKPTLKESSETEDDDDDDDLGSPSLEIRTRPSPKAPPSAPQILKPRPAQSLARDSPSLHRTTKATPPTTHKAAPNTTKDTELLGNDDDDNDFLSRLAQRQEARQRNREQRKQAAIKAQSSKRETDDIIPGFL
ncbi:hypothetical protein F4804DRAFT_85799 [Jackrogersella minutella]|nr:hypothetical protein F4804DRAFT_85799 [Jackrogersella minutella]